MSGRLARALRWLGLMDPEPVAWRRNPVVRSAVMGKLNKRQRKRMGLNRWPREEVWQRVAAQDAVHQATVRTLRARRGRRGRLGDAFRRVRARASAVADRAWCSWRRWRAA